MCPFKLPLKSLMNKPAFLAHDQLKDDSHQSNLHIHHLDPN